MGQINPSVNLTPFMILFVVLAVVNVVFAIKMKESSMIQSTL